MTKRKNNKSYIEYEKKIKDHYDKVAKEEKDNPASTMANTYVREAETVFITNMIRNFTLQQQTESSTDGTCTTGPFKDGRVNVLDVGCGNGYTLESISNNFPEMNFTGLEFNDSLRALANKRFSKSSIHVHKGDIRKKEILKKFDVDILICQRVIINILNPEHQKKALENLVSILNDGGLLILIECFKSGLTSLNVAREEFKLGLLPPAHHNLYLEDDFLDIFNLKEFDLSHKELLSTHYFVSRVLHPYFLDMSEQNFVRNSEFVSFFSNSFPTHIGTYSPLKLLSFRKGEKA